MRKVEKMDGKKKDLTIFAVVQKEDASLLAAIMSDGHIICHDDYDVLVFDEEVPSEEIN